MTSAVHAVRRGYLPASQHAVAQFAARLDWLLNNADSAPMTHLEVVAALRAQGHRLSAGYLSQLRNGVRTRPSNGLVAALAHYFRVDVEYFYVPARMPEHAAAQHDRCLAGQMSQPRLRRLLTTASGLSAESLELLADVAARLYAGEYDAATTAATA
ncbi:transcriptional regulator [Nocardia yamanashiensis]|uniref:transcriptional regulator n=1 Tax=Nocardia yamanashiensis TaxID=209247 RepID=UPI0022B841AA|nr:transcriptional regulator [Nocardia yamanashiensis]